MSVRHARVEIDLNAIRHNYHWLRQQSGCRTLAVIKADAYGHGAVEVAKALPDADAFAVATIKEALQLRQHGIEQHKILVLGGFHSEEEYLAAQQFRLDCVLHQPWQIELLQQQPPQVPLEFWLKFDSGMGRLGFPLAQADQLIQHCMSLPGIKQLRLMTHFANADAPEHELNQQQLAAMMQLRHYGLEMSLGNSAASIGVARQHSDWDRTGIALYGGNPFAEVADKPSALLAAMTFKTHLMAINPRQQGQSIGYGSRWQCPTDRLIGVAAVGYADGYPRHANDSTKAWVRGQTVALAGRVSMDMITLDLSQCPQAEVGDEVILWGANPNIDTIADASETIAYELMCHVGRLNQRVWLNP